MIHSQCSGTNRDGGPCSAQAQPGREWCRWHDPALEADRAEWRRKGGKARSSRARARKHYAADGLTPREVHGLLSTALRDVLVGRIEPSIATAAANVARALVTVKEASELEERLTALEKAAGVDRRMA